MNGAWPDGALRSPLSGLTLRECGPHALATAQGERWPVIEGIPFLRAGRAGLAARALARLDDGDAEGALALLLADQDDWARTPPPDEPALRALVARAGAIGFRDAMAALSFGPVGTYFAHRWSDPTFLSGLALAEAHGLGGSVFELACGAGHFLRAFAPHAQAAGGDVVFAKLWLARRFIAPSARLVCFDAAHPWPLRDAAFDTVFCHDALYFLPEKPRVAAEMARVAPARLVGHAHNALTDNLSAGAALPPEGYASLFPGALLYDDRELTAALVEARPPRPRPAAALAGAPAVALAAGAGAPRPVRGGVAMPPAGARLRRNPLYRDGRIAWPSARYEAEYAALATYPSEAEGPEAALAGDPAIEGLVRRRVLLDLPAGW